MSECCLVFVVFLDLVAIGISNEDKIIILLGIKTLLTIEVNFLMVLVPGKLLSSGKVVG